MGAAKMPQPANTKNRIQPACKATYHVSNHPTKAVDVGTSACRSIGDAACRNISMHQMM
jgi:hypothetical protein